VGLNAALISGFNPIGVLFTSIILAGIQTGGSAIARSTTVPLEISSVIQGCITLFISVKLVINFVKVKKASKQA
ncbi:MAG: ABC transporter permease, partial [Acetivibrio sp.]